MHPLFRLWTLNDYAAVHCAALFAVIIGSQMGAYVMSSWMHPRQLKQIFGLVLLAIAARMIWGLAFAV